MGPMVGAVCESAQNFLLQEGTTAAQGSHGIPQGCRWIPMIGAGLFGFFSGS